MTNLTKTLLIAAALLPAAGALAASDNPFAGYQRGVASVTSAAPAASAGPAMACSSDPFTGYRQAFNTGGPAQTCHDAVAMEGTQGPAGPTMATAWSDPFEGYKRGIAGTK